MRVAGLRHDRRRIPQHGARRIGRQRHEALGQWPLDAQDRREAVAVGAAIALIVVRPAPIVVGGPSGGGGDEQQAALLRCFGCRAHDENVFVHVSAAAFFRSRHFQDVAARAPISRNREAEGYGPAAANDRAIVRRIAPLAFQASGATARAPE